MIFKSYRKRERVKVFFDGIDENDGLIAEATDEATGLVDEIMTIGNILTIAGSGIKIEGDDEHSEMVGVFFIPETGDPVKAQVIALNEPRTLKLLVPAELKAGIAYQLIIETMSSTKSSGRLLKKVRNIQSEFSLVAA